MIELKGNNAYFIPPKNRYGLSTNETFDLTEHDFTILVRVKVDWDSMVAGEPSQEGGIVAKNGRHCGINSFKYADGRTYIKVQYWTSTDSEEFLYGDIWFDVKENKDWMDVAMIHDAEEKTITIDVDGKTQHKTYEGEIIDYRDSWIWIGANNSLDSCAVEHRGFLYGDISYISIFDESLTSSQTSDLFSMKNQKIFDVETVSKKTAAVYTFNDEEMTPYKVYDISNNGNHMVLFDNKWMAKNFE